MLDFTSYWANASPNHRTYQPTPVREAAVGETRSNTCWEEVEKEAPSHADGGRDAGAAPAEAARRVLKELKAELPYDPAVPLPDTCHKMSKHLLVKTYAYTDVHCAVI